MFSFIESCTLQWAIVCILNKILYITPKFIVFFFYQYLCVSMFKQVSCSKMTFYYVCFIPIKCPLMCMSCLSYICRASICRVGNTMAGPLSPLTGFPQHSALYFSGIYCTAVSCTGLQYHFCTAVS